MVEAVPPPPLPPASSSKRILLALLLCCLVCAHRIYVGRWLTGLVQITCAIGLLLWMKAAYGQIWTMLSTGPVTVDTLERVSDWEQTHHTPWTFLLAAIAFGVWIALDAARLAAGKFHDGQGRPLTRWA